MDGASILKEFMGGDVPESKAAEEPKTGADILRAFLDQPEPARPKPDPEPEIATGGEMILPTGDAPAARPVPSLPASIPEWRAALAPPADGFTPGNILPFAYRDRPDGGTDTRLDWGNTLRSLGTGALDLLEGTGQAGPSPLAGTVTPEGTMALMSLAGTRFARSPAAGTGQAVADMAALGPEGAQIAQANRLLGTDAARTDARLALAGRGGEATPAPGAPAMAPGMASAAGPMPGMGAPMPGVTSAEGEGVILPGMAGTQARGGTTAPQARTTAQIQREDGVGYNEAYRIQQREAAAAQPRPGMGAATSAESVTPEYLQGLRADIAEIVKANNPQLQGTPADLSAAATPADAAAMSGQTMKANRKVAELGTILRPIEGEDTAEYVKGSVPTLAEWKGNPATSQTEVVARQRNPDAFEARLAANNKARIDAYESEMGSEAQVDTIDQARRAAAARDEQRIMRVAQPVDLNKAEQGLSAILTDPRFGEVKDVTSVLAPYRERLAKMIDDEPGGVDPRRVWGLHDDLQNQITKAKSATAPERFAKDQLVQLKRAVDDAMTQATDGAFREFLDTQSDYFAQMNALKELQAFRPRLTNRNGDINANAYHRWLIDLAVRRAKPGVDPSMDIPDATMAKLTAIDQDLKRAGRIDLGKPRGSPTNLFFEIANGLGLAGVHAATAFATSGTGGVGNIVAQGMINAAKQRAGAFTLNRLTNRHLAPPPNRLDVQPPAP